MEEIFKDIEGYDGDYQISNFGRVRSFKGVDMIYLKPQIARGYRRVSLHKNRIRRGIFIHRTVWDHFGDSKRNGRILQVDHIDNVKTNNRIDNLQLLSQRENTTKAYLTTNKSSKYIGVSWVKSRNKWVSMITINGSQKNLGRFKTEYEAHLAYEKALNELKSKTIPPYGN